MKNYFNHRLSLIVITALVISVSIGSINPVQAQALSIPAQINKRFSPLSIVVGATSLLSVTIYNPNTFQLDNASWADNLTSIQPGLFIATPNNLSNTCGGTVTAVSGATSLSLAGGIVPPQVGSTAGSCTISINVSSLTAGNLINTIPIGALTAVDHDNNTITVSNTTPASATLQVGSVQPPSLSKSFTPNTIMAGQVSQLAIVITNNDLSTALTNTTVTDSFPLNVVLANTTTSLTGCGSGTLTDSGGGVLVAGTSASVKLNNGTVAANSTCTIRVNVTSLTQGAYTNTIPAGPAAGSIQTQQGVTNASPASAPLNVQQTVSVIKSFAPNTIAAGGASTLTITLQNPTGSAYTGAGFSDTLPGPLLITGSPSTTCGGSLTAISGTNSIQLSGGTIPASVTPPAPVGSCTITIPVIAPINSSAATYTNTIPVGGLTTSQGISNTAAANANIVVTSASVTKAFAPGTFSAGGTTTLTITLHNPTATLLTVLTISDTLPSPLTVVNGTAATTCAGGIASTPTSNSVSLSGGTIPANNGTCTITVTVTAPLSTSTTTVTNTIPAGALSTAQGATNASPATASVTVQSLTVTKAFSGAIPAGGTATLTITLQNLTASPYTGAVISDTLPSPLTVVNGTAATTCAGGTASTTLPNIVSLSGGTIPANSSCTITVTISAPATATSGTYTNTILANTLTTTEGASNSSPATANATLQALSITKAFAPTSFPGDGVSTSTLTITVQNQTAVALTNAALTDTLPAVPNTNLSVVLGSAATTCVGGTASTTAPRTVSLAGATIAANSSCTITVNVIAAAGSPTTTYTNNIPAPSLTDDQFVTNTAVATANVTVNAAGGPMLVTKAFQTSPIASGANDRLRISITAPADTNLTNFSITDNLPAGMVITNSIAPAKSANCIGGTFTAASGAITGDNKITWGVTGGAGTINAGLQCQLTVYVTSTTAGLNTNTINPSDISSTPSRPIAAPATASVTVTSMSVSKAFYPTMVGPNGISTLTITLKNVSTSPLTLASNPPNAVYALTDTLPGTTTNGLVIAPTPNASTTCGGTLTAAAGTQLIRLNGGTIPAQVGAVPGICTINVDVQGKGMVNPYTNTITNTNVNGIIGATIINPSANANAILTIANISIQVVKGFNPLTVFGGSASTLTVQLTNPNAGDLTGISFIDHMDQPLPGLVIANPPNLSAGTCGGALSAAVGASSFSFSGGTLLANTSCVLTLSVTMNVNGNLTNTIPAGAVTTANGANDTQATSASLTNLPGASVSKFFAPNSIAAGGSSTLTITIQNTGNTPLTGMGLTDTLPGILPNGLMIASLPNASTTCNNASIPVLTAVSGTQSIQLANGSVAGNSNCTIQVSVTSLTAGDYQNCIPVGALTNNEGAHNQLPACDTLNVTALAALGDFVWNDVNHNGIQDAGETGIAGVAVTLYASDGTTVLGTTTTDVSGAYHFTGLAAGSYVVGFTTPSGYQISPQMQGSDTAVDSNPDTTTGKSGTVTLIAGQTDNTIDAGMYQPAQTSCTNSISGTVFDDANHNGAFDSGEQVISGVLVNLYDQNNNIVTYAITGANGSYSFSHLAAGTYKVVEIDPNGYSSTTLNTVGVPLGCINSNPVVNFGDQKNAASITDPAVTKYGDPSSAKIGDTVTYMISVGNNGAANALNVVLTDTKPLFLDIISIGISPNNNFPINISGNTFTINFGTVTPTDFYVVTVLTRVNNLGRPPGDNNNVSITTSSSGDPIFNNNAAVFLTITGGSTGGGGNGANANLLPVTGFAPGVLTSIAAEPANAYDASSDLIIEIPVLGIKTAIVGVPQSGNTWDVTWLGNQVGYLDGTAFPTWSGNSVLTGHVYGADGLAGPFINLHNLKWGDQVIIHAFGQRYIYQVRENKVVSPASATVFKHETNPWLTLVTCKDYDAATNTYLSRVAVRAVLVGVSSDIPASSGGGK